MVSQEKKRLESPGHTPFHQWKKWGPYVSERAWGTVREDYSKDGNAWRYLTHDMARSMTYRWSEDGLAGICDMFQNIVFSIALWNGKDPILKERLFGLDHFEGNHGEDVKELYFYLDSTPTHSYMKFLYKYPQGEFPYKKLVEENQKRGTKDREFEIVDTGIFAEQRYFDVVVEYGKEQPRDIAIRIEIFNRGPEAATIHLLPQLFFRNRWGWDPKTAQNIPDIREIDGALLADPANLPPVIDIPFDYPLDPMFLYGNEGGETLFTDNESNFERLYGSPNKSPFVKDAFHRYVIGKEACLNPQKKGTKAAFHYQVVIPPFLSKVFHLRLTTEKLKKPLQGIDEIIDTRRKEADEFYREIQPSSLSSEDRKIHRQALSGMLWSKQFYHYDVERWLEGDPAFPPPPPERKKIRNNRWRHIKANTVISMPDKWEYPWFAAWDLAFHTVSLGIVDMELAKQQLHMLLKFQYQHPSGHIPAYEWNFSDLNPPAQAWAAWRLYKMDKARDANFLEIVFLKLVTNFTWWVNKVDKKGNNFFEGGFLGLDNISVIDRSKPLPAGGYFEESDGTGWMGFFALMMMRIALELSFSGKAHFQELATMFFQHFVNISYALQGGKGRNVGMWDEEDGFFYDVLCDDKGNHSALKVRSFVGIIPFYSIDFFDEDEIEKCPKFRDNFHLFLQEYPEKCKFGITKTVKGNKKRYILSLASREQIDRAMQKIWDPGEFFSPYGLRSLSKFHEQNPFHFAGSIVGYEPGESYERIKGGNSNWRGPIWFPTNFLALDAMKRLDEAYQGTLTIKTKTELLGLTQLLEKLRNRLIDLFRPDGKMKRPVHGDYSIFYEDPHFRDLILFYEHYHGDTGRGLGASHQTGWSGLVAALLSEQGPTK